MRRLALHTSALSDSEYNLYIALLNSVALNGGGGPSEATEEDAFYEKLTVNVREARGWLKGRYSHLSASVIDGILNLFSPSDTLSGMEFFAALRLVTHAENGKDPKRSLAFHQAQLGQRSRSVYESLSGQSEGTGQDQRPLKRTRLSEPGPAEAEGSRPYDAYPPRAELMSQPPGSTSMMQRASPTITLYYYILGDKGNRVLPITLPETTTIPQLIESIKDQRPLHLQNADVSDLTIYKLSTPLPITSFRSKPPPTSVNDLEDIEYLESSLELSVCFPNHGGMKQLDIIVDVLPQLLTISPSNSNDRVSSQGAEAAFNHSRSPQRVVDWLLELHGKIWNQQGRQQELFRTVELTTAHYEQLEEHMTNLHPGRQEGKYSTGDGVLSIKLAVLQSSNIPSITPGPAPGQLAHPTSLDDEQIGNDNGADDELCSLFPFTLEYLDLSNLRLKTPPPQMPLPLLVRQEYKFLSTLLGNRPMGGWGSAIISGQPGIGKTSYLYLRLVQSMIAGTACLFQTEEGTVYHVSESITIVDSWLGGPIIAFCDADGISSKPPAFIRNEKNIQIIAASSPNGAYENWTDKMPTFSFVMKFITTLWSPQELFLTGMFLHPKDLPYSCLQESTYYFGCNPRRCFNASSNNMHLVQLKEQVLGKIRSIPKDHDLLTFLNETRSRDNLSHAIFQLSPKNEMRILDQAEVAAVSAWALDALLEKYEAQQDDASFQFYNSIVNMPEAGTLRGQMFERQVLKYLGNLEKPELFSIRCLADSTISQWLYPGPTTCSKIQSSAVTKLLQDAVTNKTPLHNVPKEPNFPSVDSILYNPGEVLTGIQITIRKDHPVAVVGLKRIQAWLKRKTLLSDLRPSISGNHWWLIFVVPSDIAPSYMEQTFKDDTNTGEWCKKVNQYVLGMKEDTIWGRTMKY